MCRSKTPTIGKLAKKSSKKYGHNASVSGKKYKIIFVSGDFDKLCCVVL